MELARISVKRLKALPPLYTKFPDVKGIKFEDVLPSVVINAMDGTFDLNSPIIKEIWDYMGNKPEDYAVAVRVAKLQMGMGVNGKTSIGTKPELITYDWLRSMGYNFIWQASTYGGRAQRGGITVDIMVEQGGEWNAMPINGDYWHSYGMNQGQDAAEKVRLMGQVVNGMRISKVTALWEHSIRYRRPEVFLLALQGIELA